MTEEKESPVVEDVSPFFTPEELDIILEKGEGLVRVNKYDSAFDIYSGALKTATSPSETAALLTGRSNAFIKMSEWLRSIPAAQSEASAVFALSPDNLAQLALNDALRATKLKPQRLRCYCLQGDANVLLEKYADAERAFLEGLSIDPSNEDLQKGLRAVQQHLASSRPGTPTPGSANQPKRQRRLVRSGSSQTDDAECSVCMKLLYEPVTTPCGHSFCRPCFLRAVDHSNKCPNCRAVLHVGRDLPVTIVLKHLIQHSFPEEYEARRKEEAELGAGGEGGTAELPMPLFVMHSCLPGDKMRMNIFEPRYRLMIRRCMEGSRRFGMATVNSAHELNNIATECDIIDFQPSPDGRYLLEVEGRRRFKIESSWEQDGYRVARPAFFSDEVPEKGTPEREELDKLAEKVMGMVNEFIATIKQAVERQAIRSTDAYALIQVLRASADPPKDRNPETLSFWVSKIAPLDAPDAILLLRMTSPKERLEYIRGMIEPRVQARKAFGRNPMSGI